MTDTFPLHIHLAVMPPHLRDSDRAPQPRHTVTPQQISPSHLYHPATPHHTTKPHRHYTIKSPHHYFINQQHHISPQEHITNAKQNTTTSLQTGTDTGHHNRTSQHTSTQQHHHNTALQHISKPSACLALTNVVAAAVLP